MLAPQVNFSYLEHDIHEIVNMNSFVSGLICSVLCLWELTVFGGGVVAHLCHSLIFCVLLSDYSTAYLLSILRIIDIWNFPFWLIKKLLSTFINMAFGEHVYSFLMDRYLRMELLSHPLGICLALTDIAKQFSQSTWNHFPQAMYENFSY